MKYQKKPVVIDAINKEEQDDNRSTTWTGMWGVIHILNYEEDEL